jgi:anaerobic dimethyl sulfoxide reductase subunit A
MRLMTQPDSVQQIPFTCTLDCGSRCELVAHVRDGIVVRVDAPPGRADSIARPRLIPCARGRSQGRARDASQRVLFPLRRTGPKGSGQFQRIEWREALDEIADRLCGLKERYGTAALLHATGAGSVSGRGFSGAAASDRFFSHWGPVTDMTGGMSYHCAATAADWMFGQAVPGSDRAVLLDSRLIVLWGMNPAETHMGPNTAHFLALARDRGARVVLIDPRYTDSGILADQWIPIRPGTDAALVAAMVYVLETEELTDRDFMASHTAGYEPYRRYVLGEADGVPKTPEWAEARTGVSAGTIYQLARDYGTIKPAALLAGWGPQRTRFGEQIARALIVLACLGGNVGVRGGGLASIGTRWNAIPVDRLPPGPHKPARRVFVGSWAKAILEDQLQPPIKLVHIVGSNLINRSPDVRANARALTHADYVVVHEPFFTPTARHADIVLPICTELERSDLVTSWGHDLHLMFSRQAVAPAGETRTDFWVFSQLAERLGFREAYTQGKSEEEWLEQFLDPRHLDVESLRRDGIMRQDSEPRVALADYRLDPAAHALPTPSGRIEISTPRAKDYGLPTIPSYVESVGEEPDVGREKGLMQLITPHYKFRSNSCLHAVPWLQRLEQHAAWINSRDALARNIADGDWVDVTNARGTIRLPAKVTERIMPGVVCVYQGTWYRPGPDGVDEGGCANVLTEQRETPSGGFATHSTWVEVRRSDG